MLIDFYVPIIDNYWDIWFAINLALIMTSGNQELKIRFFSDDEKLFDKMIWGNKQIIKLKIVFYNLNNLENHTPSKNIFTFFDYRLQKEYLQKWESWKNIIQFWYFLLHKWVEKLHLTSYEVDWNKITHFIPSLLENTWGILINIFEFKDFSLKKIDFLEFINLKYKTKIPLDYANKKWITVFVYRKTLDEILETITNRNKNEVFFIFDWKNNCHPEFISGSLIQGNETKQNIKNSELNSEWKIIIDNIIFMPFIELLDFNNFLSLSDLNIIRWENSLCTSLSYWKPTLWDIYKENNNAHIEKLKDFTNYLLTFNKDYLLFNKFIEEFNLWIKSKWIENFLNWYKVFEEFFNNLSKKIVDKSNLVNNLKEYVIWIMK